MSCKIIGFLGKKGHGKDTCADFLVSQYGYDKHAFATTIKDFLKLVFGLNDDQLYGNSKEVIDPRWNVSPRTLMQFFGTTVFRDNINEIMPHIKNNFWVECLKNRINTIAEENRQIGKDTLIAVSDVRFQNEADAIKSLGGIIIKINRESVQNEDNHLSEAGIDDVTNFDYLIENNSTIDNMHKQIEYIINQL